MNTPMMPPRGAMQEAGMPDQTPDYTGCVTIPLKALAQPDDKENMVQPEEGDTVNFQVAGIIRGIEGDNAMVEPSAVNGQQLGDDESQSAESTEPPDEGAGLRQEALQQ